MAVPISRVFIMEQRPIAPDVSRSNDQRTPRNLEEFSYVDNQNTLRDLGDVSTPRNFHEALFLDQQETPEDSQDFMDLDYDEVPIGIFYHIHRTSFGRHDAIYPVEKGFQFQEKEPNNETAHCHIKENYLPGAELENPRPVSMQQDNPKQRGIPPNRIVYKTEQIAHINEYAIKQFINHVNDVVKRRKADGTLGNSAEDFKNLAKEFLKVENPRQMFSWKTKYFFLDMGVV
ncbi:unnamed protein product [Clonostachys rosea f. rosea IK726]|uniref:Uncharacterized protein n=1 Tax=Clonostachys rosea f. rosea IK726 TaxID=1349383 RepID=A0ACA9UH13_BIOOC|nr:unnamed protein product [Clonostachys rosea f. rosea IK726]